LGGEKTYFFALNRTVVLRAKFRSKIVLIRQNRTSWQVCCLSNFQLLTSNIHLSTNIDRVFYIIFSHQFLLSRMTQRIPNGKPICLRLDDHRKKHLHFNFAYSSYSPIHRSLARWRTHFITLAPSSFIMISINYRYRVPNL
jgi:hypothetical protein